MFKTQSARSADLIRRAMDLLDEGFLLFDRKDRLQLANRAAEALCGLVAGEMVGRRLDTILRRLEAVIDASDDLGPSTVPGDDPWLANSLTIRLRDGRRVAAEALPIVDGDQVVGRLWRLNDLAEGAAGQPPSEVHELESLGVLAGGIAHDFNNLLSSILGHTELGLEDVDPDSEAAESLRSIARVAERASQLTQQMLAYAGKGTVLVEPIDLSQMVREVLELVSVSLAPAVDLDLDLARDLPPIIADAVQIRQVVMNLVLNAAEALADGGTVRISTGVHRLDEPTIATGEAGSETSPGEFAYVEVGDSGPGMDEATLERIFDPFFSTKFTGRGLGLAAVHGIVRGHQGLLRVASRPGHGTTITVDLPCGYGADSAISSDSS